MWAHVGPLLSLKLQKKNFLKPRLFLNMLITLIVKFMQPLLMLKFRKIQHINFITSFGMKTSNQGFSWKIICVNFKTYITVTLIKRSEKFQVSIFHNNWKHFFGSSLVLNSKGRYFTKDPTPPVSKSTETLIAH